MSVKEILDKFHEIAVNPAAQKDRYLKEGKKVVLAAPVYTPEEIIHSMGLAPMAAWGADIEISESKKYFPTFICSIVQSILELGVRGSYEGVSAIVIPSLCDSLKVLGENWKYAVPSIPFIPMTYPQNRKPAYGTAFTKEGYRRVIRDLEKATGETFVDEKLAASIRIYNEHNQVMRELTDLLPDCPAVSAAQRSDIFKSAGFLLKEEHTVMVRELMDVLKKEAAKRKEESVAKTDDEKMTGKIRIMTTGILSDSPSLLSILDENGFQIVADDVAVESRQYRTDAPAAETAIDSLAQKFSDMDYCSVLYDVEKKRVRMIAEQAKVRKAQGVLVVLTKFCDPEEFDYPLIKKECEREGIPCILLEVDRQMTNYEQARTMLEGFKDIVSC